MNSVESAEVRRRTMQAVKSKDTGPEMTVRRLAHRMGYRFRLHSKYLPGRPDMVFPRLRKVVFVHGCFWHGHTCVRGARVPTRNRDYWLEKVQRNRLRDASALRSIKERGWDATVLWECEIRNEEQIANALQTFLESKTERSHVKL